MGKVDWTRGDCRMGGDWTGRDCIVMLYLTQVCAIVFIFYEGNQYPIIFHGSVITFIDIQQGLKIIIIVVKSFFRYNFFFNIRTTLLVLSGR